MESKNVWQQNIWEEIFGEQILLNEFSRGGGGAKWGTNFF